MLVIIKKPSNREARNARKIMTKKEEWINRKDVDLVILDHNLKIIGIIQKNGSKEAFFLFLANEDWREELEEKTAQFLKIR